MGFRKVSRRKRGGGEHKMTGKVIMIGDHLVRGRERQGILQARTNGLDSSCLVPYIGKFVRITVTEIDVPLVKRVV